MNFAGHSDAAQGHNVISLFGHNTLPEMSPELFTEFKDEFDLETEIESKAPSKEAKTRNLVTAQQFPDQSMYTLDLQLKDLKTNLDRLKFYLSDLKDALPM